MEHSGNYFGNPSSENMAEIGQLPTSDGLFLSTSTTSNEFPQFSDGNVVIILSNAPEDRYCLHMETLCRSSPWFGAQCFQSNVLFPVYHFTLAPGQGTDFPHLVLQSSNNIDSTGLDESYVRAHRSLLRMIYSQPPNISTADINTARRQAEDLVRIAKFYGCLALVRPHISHVLTEFCRELYLAVSRDPPSWVNLAIDLESKAIFTEAIIHCAGGFPSFSWPTPLSKVAPSARQVVHGKAVRLSHLRNKVDIRLLTEPIVKLEGNINPSIEDSFASWMLMHLFRDWVAGAMNERHIVVHCQHGNLYRLIARGGEAYLDEQTMVAMMDTVGHEWTEELATQFQDLKTRAQDIVEPIAHNYLFIEADKFPYLTCTELTATDFPWAQ